MAAAKSLTAAEIEQAWNYIGLQANAVRNQMMFALSAWAGLRVGEIAGLTIADVRNSDGGIRSEVFLAAHRVKHGHSRTVYLNTRLQQQLAQYVSARQWLKDTQPLFPTHRGPLSAFSANTLAQYFFWMYRRAGIKNASSHSGRKTFLTSLSNKEIGRAHV